MNAAYSKVATLVIHGDILTVNWNGGAWEAPVNGTQHAWAKEAMREELEAYLESCGEDVANMGDEIAEMLKEIEQ